MTAAPPAAGHAPSVLLRELLAEQARPGGAFAPDALRVLDRDEAFPARPCRVLDEFGLAAHYVPVTHGGRLGDLSELIHLVRAVARHDVTVAVAHAKTFLGAASVWVADDAEQAGSLGRGITSGQVVSWALTERGHGADLLAGELTAERTASGWRLDGEKWLINNAGRADHICVLARTGEPGDARGFDLFLVDTRDLTSGSHERLPKVRTHGIRGADISGARFDGAPVPSSAHIGPDGAGLEIVLKALQLTRTVCTGLSLGACENALGLAVRFTARRRLYGRLLSELPRVRRILADALADLLLMEAVSEVAGRAAHTLPREMAVVSAVVKAHVPGTADALIAELGELLGVRAFFTEEYADGTFAKLERDHRIVAIFDGSTDVNRHALIKQFPLLSRAAARRGPDREGLAAAAALHTPVPPLDPASLTLAGNRGCSVLQALPEAVARAREEITAGTAPAALDPLLDGLAAACADLERELADHTPTFEDVPAADFALARRYELCFTAAAALHIWVHREQTAPGTELWAEARWLRLCLSRALRRLDRPAAVPEDAAEALVEELVRTEGRGMTLLAAR